MPSTFSPSLRLELIGQGEQIGTWGTTTNRNLGTLLEEAIAGSVFITLPDTDYTLEAANGVPDQARNMVLVFGGVLTAPRNVIAPAASKVYIVRNSTLGGQNVVMKTETGAGVTIPPGRASLVFCDGTDFFAGITYIAGNLVTDSLTLTTPLGVASGGTGGSNAAQARANLGMGSASTLNATSSNVPNTAVLRDASGNFSAGTITGDLNGTATTANNALNFNGQPPGFYAHANAEYDWEQKFLGSTTSVDLTNTYGSGTFAVLTANGPNTGSLCVVTPPTSFLIPTYTFSSGVQNITPVLAHAIAVSFGSITAIYKLRKL